MYQWSDPSVVYVGAVQVNEVDSGHPSPPLVAPLLVPPKPYAYGPFGVIGGADFEDNRPTIRAEVTAALTVTPYEFPSFIRPRAVTSLPGAFGARYPSLLDPAAYELGGLPLSSPLVRIKAVARSATDIVATKDGFAQVIASAEATVVARAIEWAEVLAVGVALPVKLGFPHEGVLLAQAEANVSVVGAPAHLGEVVCLAAASTSGIDPLQTQSGVVLCAASAAVDVAPSVSTTALTLQAGQATVTVAGVQVSVGDATPAFTGGRGLRVALLESEEEPDPTTPGPSTVPAPMVGDPLPVYSDTRVALLTGTAP
jgi:hypothetical protein